MKALAALALAVSPALAAAFDLQGHRGARGLAPENTLPAFAAALSLGVSTLELDTGVTRDGVVVIAHDRALNPDLTRDAQGNWIGLPGPLIRAATYAELQRYDVGRLRPGSDYARRYPEQKPVDGTRIPRLADLFGLVKRSGSTAVRFNIETKISPEAPDQAADPETFAKALLEAVRADGMEARVMVQSFDWRTLQAVQRLAPGVPTVYLTSQQKWGDNVRAGDPAGSPWLAGFQHRDHGSVPRMVKAAGGAVWSPFFGDLDAVKLAEAHALGLKVIPWTVNDPPAMQRLIIMGVDGLISDRPDLARAVMAERGLPLPAPAPVRP